jgi:hypothetical protein
LPSQTGTVQPFRLSFFGNRDLIQEVNGDPGDGCAWIWVSARTRQAFNRFLSPAAPVKTEWEAA